MDTTYLVCAALGGSILVLQFALQILGGADLDVDVDADPTTDVGGETTFKLLSAQTIFAGIAFFGLAGMASRQAELGPGASLVIASAAGLVAIVLVAWILSMLLELQSKGNLDIEAHAAGARGTCYLRVPEPGQGSGRVHVEVQGRTIECQAVSEAGVIPTGAQVEVVAVRGPRTLVVREIRA